MNFRSPSFTVVKPISSEGLVVEGICIIVTFLMIYKFFSKHGFYRTIAFFLPLFLFAAYVEGDWITRGRFEFHKLNFYLWDTPIAIILYYSAFYLVFLLYQFFGKGVMNRLKSISIHLFIDIFITTPLAIMLGFWSFRSTLFDFYPFVAPIVHIGEILAVLSYVLFQERLLTTSRVKENMRPVLSLTTIIVFLLIYIFVSPYFES
ncbi:MAG: hypothetical protein ABIH88_00235 [Patescibacteria group bacterium]|nr:hypothetical protein [Patescibacteria group bacterium]